MDKAGISERIGRSRCARFHPDIGTATFHAARLGISHHEGLQSVLQSPGFANPSYPPDDYSLPKGSPGVSFVPWERRNGNLPLNVRAASAYPIEGTGTCPKEITTS